MAYQGTTSTAPNVPRLVSQSIGGTNKVWMYRSTHTQAESAAAGFITDGQSLGISLGNVVMVQGSTTFIQSQHTVNAVSATGVTLSAGLLVSSAS